jgi:hypothetical protein
MCDRPLVHDGFLKCSFKQERETGKKNTEKIQNSPHAGIFILHYFGNVSGSILFCVCVMPVCSVYNSEYSLCTTGYTEGKLGEIEHFDTRSLRLQKVN